jgi:undecaprenyl-diphosphatase
MTDMIRALILGVVEGLTEFIPVSSTGHLIITGDLLEFTSEFAKTFDVAIQLGAILAVVIIFKDKFIDLLRFKKEKFPNIRQITATTIPALIFGFALHGAIKKYLFSPVTVAVGLILGSILMIYADKFARQHKLEGESKQLSLKDSLFVGLFQTLALWPGMSRSGSTISGSIFMGMDYRTASAYSFICAVPVMFCATGYELLKAFSAGGAGISHEQLVLLAVGFFTSLAFGWLSIVFFLKLIARIKLVPFAIYRIILAVGILLIYLIF